MKKDRNEEMLQQMFNNNFIDMSIEQVEGINGGFVKPVLHICYGVFYNDLGENIKKKYKR